MGGTLHHPIAPVPPVQSLAESCEISSRHPNCLSPPTTYAIMSKRGRPEEEEEYVSSGDEEDVSEEDGDEEDELEEADDKADDKGVEAGKDTKDEAAKETADKPAAAETKSEEKAAAGDAE